MDVFSKTVQYSVESIVDGINVAFNFSEKDGKPSPIQFSYTTGKVSVTGSINPDSDYIYYNVSGGIIEDSTIIPAIIAKAKSLPLESKNAI